MKTLRLCLLMLLAVLLPIRGAAAAAMVCEAVNLHHAAAVAQAGHDAAHAGQAHHLEPGHHHDASHDAAADDTAQDDGTTFADKCQLCSACCAAQALPGSAGSLSLHAGLSDTAYPDVSTPALSFLSDGQERPPRSI